MTDDLADESSKTLKQHMDDLLRPHLESINENDELRALGTGLLATAQMVDGILDLHVDLVERITDSISQIIDRIESIEARLP